MFSSSGTQESSEADLTAPHSTSTEHAGHSALPVGFGQLPRLQGRLSAYLF